MKKTAEKGKKIVFGVLLVLACILMPQKMTNAAGNTVPTAVDNLTVSLRNKVNMAVTDNGYMRVAYDGSKVRVEYYDTQFNLQRKVHWIWNCRSGAAFMQGRMLIILQKHRTTRSRATPKK